MGQSESDKQCPVLVEKQRNGHQLMFWRAGCQGMAAPELTGPAAPLRRHNSLGAVASVTEQTMGVEGGKRVRVK